MESSLRRGTLAASDVDVMGGLTGNGMGRVTGETSYHSDLPLDVGGPPASSSPSDEASSVSSSSPDSENEDQQLELEQSLVLVEGQSTPDVDLMDFQSESSNSDVDEPVESVGHHLDLEDVLLEPGEGVKATMEGELSEPKSTASNPSNVKVIPEGVDDGKRSPKLMEEISSSSYLPVPVSTPSLEQGKVAIRLEVSAGDQVPVNRLHPIQIRIIQGPESPSGTVAVGNAGHQEQDSDHGSFLEGLNLRLSKTQAKVKKMIEEAARQRDSSEGLQSQFVCHYCPRKFGSRSGCYLHEQSIHLGIKFPCQFCSKEYFRKHTRNQHMIICPKRGAAQLNVPQADPQSSSQESGAVAEWSSND